MKPTGIPAQEGAAGENDLSVLGWGCSRHRRETCNPRNPSRLLVALSLDLSWMVAAVLVAPVQRRKQIPPGAAAG